METWRPVDGYDYYEVSDLGRVRTHRGPGNTKALRQDPHVLTQRLNGVYLTVCLSNAAGKRTARTVHTLVAKAFLGPKPLGMQVAHEDGDSRNNLAANLRYKTPKENTADKVRHGTSRCGESASMSIVTEQQVLWAREQYRLGRSSAAIAAELGITPHGTMGLVRGRTWGHLPGAIPYNHTHNRLP